MPQVLECVRASAAFGLATTKPVIYFFFAFALGFSSKAACAAARRAMGTRKGEQLT
jgi:hypothetical protein